MVGSEITKKMAVVIVREMENRDFFLANGYKLFLRTQRLFIYDSLRLADDPVVEKYFIKVIGRLYKGQEIRIFGLGLKFLYSYGDHLRINWENGTKSILERETAKRLLYFHFQKTSRIIKEDRSLVPILSFPLKTISGMKSIDCFMPQLTSDKWDKISFPMNVLPTTPPKLVGPTNEIIYVQVHEMSKETKYQISEGVSHPKIAIFKSGKLPKDHLKNMSHIAEVVSNVEIRLTKNLYNETIITLEFSHVTH